MRERPSGHRIQVDLGVEPQTVDSRLDVEAPFCIALFGDFSGRGHRGNGAGGALATHQSVVVDRDTLDETIARLRPELSVRLAGERDPGVRVQFNALEDFHPDRLYERLTLFEGVRELRRRLVEPTPRTQPRASPSAPPPSAPLEGDLLDHIVQQSQVSGAAEERPPLEGGDLQAYLNRIVAPHLVPAADPRRQAVLAELDAAAADGVRALLHLAEFQALEALWRGVRLLTQGVESDAEVRLYLFDVTKADLADDQRENRDARSSRIYRLLAVPAGAPESGWGALGGLYSFGPDAADLTLLGYLGTVAGLVGAPWISAADPRLAGCDGIHTTPDAPDWAADIPPEWQAVRRLPVARWIGLAMPRFLLRLPYGKRGSRCEFLPFEELSESPLHDEYLWGNPALACLLLLIQSVAESGRPLHPGMNLEIGGLRAESLLSERALERILDHGLMPLVSIRDTDRIRLVRFQSVADPTAALGGPWGRG